MREEALRLAAQIASALEEAHLRQDVALRF